MISHSVFFWLKPEASGEVLQEMIRRAREDLTQIQGIQTLLVGTPIPTDRSVVDTSYHIGLSMSFLSEVELSFYQNHPIHQQFVSKWVKPWVSKIVVYDFASP